MTGELHAHGFLLEEIHMEQSRAEESFIPHQPLDTELIYCRSVHAARMLGAVATWQK